jgi:hypothetical protein
MAAWSEDSLAGLWGRTKTERLLAAKTLRPYHVGEDGQRYFAHENVMEHYAYKSPGTPGQACCSCCGHCEEPRGMVTTKSFGRGETTDDEDAPGLLDDLDDEGRDEPGEELLANYYDKRLEELDLVEKLSAAADALAFENAIMGLQVEQLAFRAAMRRAFG